MSRCVRTAIFLMALVGAVLAGPRPLLATTPDSDDAPACRDGTARDEIETEMASARTLAMSASYGLALEHARRLRDLIDAERRCLEEMRFAGNDDLRVAVEQEIRRNDKDRAGTEELLHLLRIALGSARRL